MRKIQALSFAAVAALAANSFATFSLSTGFETAGVPPFTPATALNGQNNWEVFIGNVAGTTPSVNVVVGNNGPSAVGTNSVQINNGPVASQSDNASVTTLAPIPLASSPLITNTNPATPVGFTNSLVTVRADLRVDDGATPLTTSSDFYALEVYDGSGKRIAGVERSNIGTPKLFVTTATGNYDAAALTGVTVPASGAYGVYTLNLNYNSGVFNVNLNGTSLGTFPLATGFGYQADPLIFNSGRGADGAFVDNFSVTAVPEPTTGIALALGGLAMLARRRRSN